MEAIMRNLKYDDTQSAVLVNLNSYYVDNCLMLCEKYSNFNL